MRWMVMLLALPLVLSGCRGRDSRKLFFIIVPSQDNPFFKSEADAASERATQLGYRVRIDSHDGDAYRQDNLIDAAIASNAAVILLDNAGSESSAAGVRRATRAGIPVFLMDREIPVDGIAKAQIIADNDQGSRLVAGEFARAIQGKSHYAELLGKESDTNAQVRTRGFHAVLDGIPGLNRVAAQSANWSQAEAFSKTETMLQAHPDIAGIIAANDTMALGAVAALRSAGRRGVVITGFDGIPDAVQSIRTGAMDATALQPAAHIAQLAVNEADQFLKTGSTGAAERQKIPCELVTRQNAALYENFERAR